MIERNSTTQTVERFNPETGRFSALRHNLFSARTALVLTGAAVAAGNAGASNTDWDIAGAQTTIQTLLGVAAAVTTFVVIYRMVKGGARSA
jgi:hypothetical protein